MVYKTLIPAESASSDLAERILLHLRFAYANTLPMERGKLPILTSWENLGFSYDWTRLELDPTRHYCRMSRLAWCWAGLTAILAASFADSTVMLFFIAVLVAVTAYGHVSESKRLRERIRSGALKPDLVDQVIAGIIDPRDIYRHVIFPWRQLFMELEKDNVEHRVAMVAMNLDWYSTQPRFLLRWSWLSLVGGVMMGIAGIALGVAGGEPGAGFVILLSGAMISLTAFAACSWRRRVLLGMVISHIEKNYIGDPVEEFKS